VASIIDGMITFFILTYIYCLSLVNAFLYNRRMTTAIYTFRVGSQLCFSLYTYFAQEYKAS
jgi:hypothetical protein